VDQAPQQDGESIDVVVMAAGKGTRMKSSLHKVLHRLGGRALVAHVVDTAPRFGARTFTNAASLYIAAHEERNDAPHVHACGAFSLR